MNPYNKELHRTVARARTKNDPHAQREAQKYDHPIASREHIQQILSHRGMPMSLKDLAGDLDLQNERDREALRRRLAAMVRDGQLVQNRRGDFGLVNKMDLVRGRVIGHPDGYGFVVPEDGIGDLFLSARQMRSVMHGDRVIVQVIGIDRRGRREGALVEVLERSTQTVVGRFYLESGVGFVVPYNRRISHEVVIPPKAQGTARDGQMVTAIIVEQPTKRSQPIGEIIEVLGDHMTPGMEVEIALRTHDIPWQWPEKVEKQVAKIRPRITAAMKRGRMDLTDLPLVTIDGEDARDFDDAIYVERKGQGWRLIVAIADVSHYVRPETALDGEAAGRGTSVYFPNRVVPMLPELLSNGLCSLNPHVERLCMVCEMSISRTGEISEYRFHEAVMRSAARLTYTQAAAIVVDKKQHERRQFEHVVPHLEDMHGLYKLLKKRREHRGAIDFETTETRIIFNDRNKIEKIVPVVRNDAHMMIEEFMISANVCAAKYLAHHKRPGLYRVHQGPSAEKLGELREFLGEFGLSLGGGDDPAPADYAALLKTVMQRPDAHLIQTVMLRSLSQARYSPDNTGHFGLALETYAHFTSPIRRYPDLIVHRAIREQLQTRRAGKTPRENMHALGEHCSMTERRADEATRDAVDWLKCQYMMDKVGQEFQGTVSSVTSFGLFVELDDLYAVGLVHVSSLENDYYHFDPVHHRLRGERTGTTYRLSDRLKVTVARVDMDEKKIDFVVSEPERNSRRRRRRTKT
jgi:ribonuclease R